MATFDERARDWDTRTTGDAWPRGSPRAIRSAVALTPTTPDGRGRVGTGLLGLALADDVGELVLAEPSTGMLEVAREKLAVLGRSGHVGRRLRPA